MHHRIEERGERLDQERPDRGGSSLQAPNSQVPASQAASTEPSSQVPASLAVSLQHPTSQGPTAQTPVSQTSVEAPDLPLPQQLALAHCPRDMRPTLAAALELDWQFAKFVGNAREPALAQMRLAWWRDQIKISPSDRAKGNPLLLRLGALWGGEEAALLGLVDGWENALGDGPPPDRAEFCAGRAAIFAAFARLAGKLKCENDAATMGFYWGLAEWPMVTGGDSLAQIEPPRVGAPAVSDDQQPVIFPPSAQTESYQSGQHPGQSGQHPGQSGQHPGQSGQHPGQSGQHPGQSGQHPGQSGQHLPRLPYRLRSLTILGRLSWRVLQRERALNTERALHQESAGKAGLGHDAPSGGNGDGWKRIELMSRRRDALIVARIGLLGR